jgi:uncharacterized SAM-binding protein YcdF (DUF218 family)
MNEVFTVVKGFLDPLFIVFILLLTTLIIFLRNSKKKSDALLLFLCIILIYGAGIAPVANYLCYYLEKDYMHNQNTGTKNNIDAVVVLGSGTKNINALKSTFNESMESLRLLHAAVVFHETGAKYLVCSGKGDGKVSEAKTMAKLAEELGVPKEKIMIEPDSINTGENAAKVSRLLDNKDLRIGLVTSAFHMKRSEREFKKYFHNVLPLPAHYLYSSPSGNVIIQYIPQSEELNKTSVAFKEIIAQLWYRLK